MNRIAVIAVSAAAVLGTVGGTYAATSGVFDSDGSGGDPTASSESGSPSAGATSEKPTKSPTSTTSPTGTGEPAQTDGQLLYMEGGTIHDGDTTVQVSGFRIGDVQDLQRISGGWLVIERTGSQDAEFNATFVDSSGATTDIGTILGTWDVNDDGDSIVALWESGPAAETDYQEDPIGYQIRDARSGKVRVQLEPDRPGYARSEAGFVEDNVVIGWTSEDDDPELLQWQSYGAGGFNVIAKGVIGSSTGPTGNRITAQTLGAPNSDDVGCLTGGATTGDDWWTQCKFTGYPSTPKFSPDGTRLLAVPARTDGFGPGAFAILDADTGKKVQGFRAPEFTADAVWADDQGLFIEAYKDADFNGGVIHRCDLSGNCEIEVESDHTLVVGH